MTVSLPQIFPTDVRRRSKRMLLVACVCILNLVTTSFAVADAPSSARLAFAAEQQDWATVEELLKDDIQIDMNAVQSDGMTALMWAAYHDNSKIAAKLLSQNADPNLANEFQITALSIACRNGNADITEAILKAGAKVNAKVNGGVTPLMLACRTGKSDVVDHLLEAGADPNLTEQTGQTALMWAAAEGHLPVVRQLLQDEADSAVTLRSGFNAFFLAARSGHVDVVFELLKHGHDIDDVMAPKRSGGKSPRKGMSAIMLALENAHYELVEKLLEAGANPNDVRSGYSPLHALTFVRKPNKGDGPNDDPPPQSTGRIGSLECAAILVQHGADVNLRLKSGRSGRGVLGLKLATPFLMAADTADVPYMKQLLKLGADPDIPNQDNCTALLAAAGIGSKAPEEEAGNEPEILVAVRLLLNLGSDINHVDQNGETAMHGAAYKNVPEVVKLLNEEGADPTVWNETNKYGWTPLKIARGFRPGNFKPDAATEQALIDVLRQHKLSIPPRPPKPANNDAYAPKKKPSKK